MAACCLGMTVVGVSFLTVGSILPELVTRMNINEGQAGVITASLPVGILVGSLVFGPIADRFSYRYLLAISCLAAAIGIGGVAYSQELIYVVVSFVVVGAGAGSLNGAANALLSDISTTEKRSANLSFLSSFFGIGALITPLVLAFFLKSTTYDTILLGISLTFLVPSVLYLTLRYPEAKHSNKVFSFGQLKLLGNKYLILLGLILFFQSGIEGLISNWSPLFLEEIHGQSQSTALYNLSIYVISFTATRLVMGLFLRVIQAFKILVASGLIMILGVVLIAIASEHIYLTSGLIVLGVGSAAGFPLVFSYVGDLFEKNSGTAFSLVLILALFGNMVINLGMGLISETFDLQSYVYLMGACVGLVLVMLVFIYGTFRKVIRL